MSTHTHISIFVEDAFVFLSLAWYRFPHVEQQRPGLTGLGSHEWWGVHLTLWLKERLLTPLLSFLPAPFPRAQTKLTCAFSGRQPVSLLSHLPTGLLRGDRCIVTHQPVPGQLNPMLLLLPEADWRTRWWIGWIGRLYSLY